MGFSFKKSESLEENVRRVIQRQGQKAVNHLEKTDGDLHKRVHQSRKRFKQIRAILRLVRPALGSKYSFENVAFRNMGRRLSDLQCCPHGQYDVPLVLHGSGDAGAVHAERRG